MSHFVLKIHQIWPMRYCISILTIFFKIVIKKLKWQNWCIFQDDMVHLFLLLQEVLRRKMLINSCGRSLWDKSPFYQPLKTFSGSMVGLSSAIKKVQSSITLLIPCKIIIIMMIIIHKVMEPLHEVTNMTHYLNIKFLFV